MKLKNCKSCGKEIAKNARVCPNCGYKYSMISGCFVYTLIFSVVIVMIGYFAAKFSGGNGTPNKAFSITQLAKAENAGLGNLMEMYRADTKFQNSDGSFIIVNFPSIKKHASYDVNNSESITNAIVIQNVTDILVTRNFVSELAYFVLYDHTGNEINISNDIWTQSGKEFSEIIIPLNSPAELQKCKYLLIGGIDKTSNNGKSKLVFRVD